jgi:hypothetical protein
MGRSRRLHEESEVLNPRPGFHESNLGKALLNEPDLGEISKIVACFRAGRVHALVFTDAAFLLRLFGSEASVCDSVAGEVARPFRVCA